jgi:smad nuclear-interacting protein 1
MTSSYERRISDRNRSRSPARSNDIHRSLRGSAYADDKQQDRQRLKSGSRSPSRKRSSVSKSRSPPRKRSKSPRFRSMRSPVRRNSMRSPPRRRSRSRSPRRKQARQARPSSPARLPKGRSSSRSPVRKYFRTTSPTRSPSRRFSRSRSRSRSRSPIPHSRRERERVDRRSRVRPTTEAPQTRSPKKEGNKDDAPKPNFGLSGKLAAETNTYNGVVLKYFEPTEARKPTKKWRLYVFKGGDKEIGMLVKD